MRTSQSLLGQAVILEPARNADNVLQPLIDGCCPLTIRQHSSTQTSDLLRFETDQGVLISSINGAGNIFFGGTPSFPPSSGTVLAVTGRVNGDTPLLVSPAPTDVGGNITFEVDDKTATPIFFVVSPGGGVDVVCASNNANDTALSVRGNFGGQTAALQTWEITPGGTQLSVLGNARDFSFDASAGTKLGATGQKVGFLGATPVVRQAGASATGIAAVLDANAKAALTALQAALAAYGLVTSPA